MFKAIDLHLRSEPSSPVDRSNFTNFVLRLHCTTPRRHVSRPLSHNVSHNGCAVAAVILPPMLVLPPSRVHFWPVRQACVAVTGPRPIRVLSGAVRTRIRTGAPSLRAATRSISCQISPIVNTFSCAQYTAPRPVGRLPGPSLVDLGYRGHSLCKRCSLNIADERFVCI
jgi:hypothetical protein